MKNELDAGYLDIKAKSRCIVVKYKGKYISNTDFDFNLQSGVIISVTGSGKTFSYEGEPFTLILVPRVMQATMSNKEDTYELIDEIESNGAIITYQKFLGHMQVLEFNDMVQNGAFRIIVDEAHTLVADKKREYRTIYALNAIFMSGTLDESFRPDLTHYKFVPENRTRIYWTDGVTPEFENGLYFVENAKALMRNYPDRSIVGKQTALENGFTNFDPHSHTKGQVFSTSAMREGISITTGGYDAVVVPTSLCRLWSNKDIIQALNRVRSSDVVRLVTKPMISKSRSKATVSWAVRSINRYIRGNDANVNSVDAELFNMLLRYGSTDGYMGVCPYGVACFFAHINRNNFDEDLYELIEFTEPVTEMKINISTGRPVLIEGNNMSIEFNGKTYTFDKKYEDRMKSWFRLQVDNNYNTLIPKLMKIGHNVSLRSFYSLGSVAKKMKKMFNKQNRRNNLKYDSGKFIRDLGKIVKVETFDKDGNRVQRFTKNTDFNSMTFSVISECPYECKIT